MPAREMASIEPPKPHSAALASHETPHSPMQRTWAAVRSGFRRYPRVLAASMLDTSPSFAPGSMALAQLRSQPLALAWLGHAGILASVDALTLVVDPVLSHRIGPRIGPRIVGPSRLQAAPAHPASLRGLDLILLTHAHFDHLDRPTLLALAHERSVVVVPKGCESLIPPGFARVITLAPGKSLRVHDATITAIEPRHWGARTVLDRHRRVNSYLLESASHRILLAGDTAATSIFDTLGPVDIAAFGIGAYDPWRHMHATPEEVWHMARSMGARQLLPIHHSTFELSDEPAEEPLERLIAAARDHTDRILSLALGIITDPNQTPQTPT